jgi:hypothetical protein
MLIFNAVEASRQIACLFVETFQLRALDLIGARELPDQKFAVGDAEHVIRLVTQAFLKTSDQRIVFRPVGRVMTDQCCVLSEDQSVTVLNEEGDRCGSRVATGSAVREDA